MNNPYNQVRLFHESFGHKQADKPTEIDEKTALNRAIWTGEELIEFLYATSGGNKDHFDSLLNKLHEGLDNAAIRTIEKNPDVSDRLVAQIDALTDISYFNYGSFAVAGVEPQPLFNIVQQANMEKLWEDGKPRYRKEDGKIQKPFNWIPPEPKLKKEIERQSYKS